MTAGATQRIRTLGPRCLGIATAILTASAAPALAASVDTASDHVAVRAFDRYVKAELASVPASRRADQSFVNSISAHCRNALAPLAHRPASAINTKAARAFINETVLDVVVEATVPLRRPLSRIAHTLSGLRWSTQRVTAIVAAFPAAERRLFSIAPSDLCADARAFARNPHAAPPGTRHFVARVKHVSGLANRAGFRFGEVLGAFHGPRDKRVIRDIGRVTNRLLAADKRLAAAEEGKLLGALGLHT